MQHFVIILLWILCVRGDEEFTVSTAEVTVSTTDVRLETTKVGSSLSEEETTVLKANTNYNSASETLMNTLTGLSHDISSGRINIIGNDTFYIRNFHFDGKAPKAYFLVGKGDEIVENGTKIQLPGSDGPLSEYDGQDIQLKLPSNITVADINWLAIWCYEIHAKIGYVYITMSPYPPQTFGFEDQVTSGPIVLVNKKTLFIPDLRYKGDDYSHLHFWVDNGTSKRFPISYESGFTGENVYINLTDGLSTDNVKYFGVSIDEKLDLGFANLAGIEGVPEANSQSKDNKPIMRLPKCCPVYSFVTPGGCEERPSIGLDFKLDFKLFDHNATHFNNASLNFSMFDFQPYVFSPDCDNSENFRSFLMEEEGDEFAILKNGSLLLKTTSISGILSQTHFCVDNIDNKTMKIFVCFPEQSPNVQQAMFVAYVTLTLVSTFCFAGTFFLYCFWLKIEDIHRKCFTAYVLAMSITFLTLTIVQIGHVEGGGCEFLGFLFQFSMTASFTLLAILCVDIFVIVRYFDDDEQTKKRKLWYLGTALGVPILFLIISLARNLTPDVPNSFFKPQYYQNNCNFDADSQRIAIFYVPISIALVVGIICLAATKKKIVENDRGSVNNYYWIDKGITYKFMWRKHFIIIVTSLLWYIGSFFDVQARSTILVAVDLVEASQGIFMLLLFVANKKTRTLILKDLKARHRERKSRNIIVGEEAHMLNTFD